MERSFTVDVEVPLQDEKRILTIGMVANKHWTAVWTPRGKKIRIISVRRARDKEIDYYEKSNNIS